MDVSRAAVTENGRITVTNGGVAPEGNGTGRAAGRKAGLIATITARRGAMRPIAVSGAAIGA